MIPFVWSPPLCLQIGWCSPDANDSSRTHLGQTRTRSPAQPGNHVAITVQRIKPGDFR